MLAGSDGILGIYFDNVELAQKYWNVSFNLHPFGGGLDTAWKSIKPVLKMD